jgi:hypothetical protein
MNEMIDEYHDIDEDRVNANHIIRFLAALILALLLGVIGGVIVAGGAL